MMRLAKRMLAIFIICMLCVSFAEPACASSLPKYNNTQSSTTAAYSSAQDFLNTMEAEGILYTYHGLDADEDDWVEVKYTGDYCDTIDIDVYFNKNGTEALFRFWNLIDFNSQDFREVLTVVNQINGDYKWVKFSVDTNDYSVTAKLDTIFPTGYAGMICLSCLEHIVNVSDVAYQRLQPYIK